MTIHHPFTHTHNPLAATAQEYQMAKLHLREVLKYRDSTNPDHQQRFHDALERQEEARERYLKELVSG